MRTRHINKHRSYRAVLRKTGEADGMPHENDREVLITAASYAPFRAVAFDRGVPVELADPDDIGIEVIEWTPLPLRAQPAPVPVPKLEPLTVDDELDFDPDREYELKIVGGVVYGPRGTSRKLEKVIRVTVNRLGPLKAVACGPDHRPTRLALGDDLRRKNWRIEGWSVLSQGEAA